jgi:tRNA(fMet)-specific endonuclease VapC
MAALAWMLDTNTLSALIKNPRGALVERMAVLDTDTLCTSIVVACELRYGAQRRGSAVIHAKVEELLSNLTVLGLDGKADRHYADIRCALEKAGTPIGSHDLFIAAHARSQGLTLVTHNLREFQRVPGLLVEDWIGTAG